MKTIARIVAVMATAIVPLVNASADGLKIVTTTSDLAAIAKAVAGDKATVCSICTGREDPHFLQAKPSYIMRARDADLWIRIGLELEIGWEMPVLDGSRNRHIRPGAKGHLDASECVNVLEIPTTPVTRAMGDVHPSGNPHYWLDPFNGRCIAAAIAERLGQLTPADAALFKTNAVAFQQSLDERMFGAELVKSEDGGRLWLKVRDGTLEKYLGDAGKADKLGGWLAAMRPLRGKQIITYHRSWTYFTDRFGLTVAAELEPKPGIPPSAAHLAEVIELAKSQGVGVIMQEPFYSQKAANHVVAKTGARVVVVANSVGGEAEAIDYVSLIDLIIKRLTAR